MPSLYRIFVIITALVGSYATAQQRPLVHSPAGAVQGVSQGPLDTFKGLPYAQPPVGPRRWRPPAPVAPWRDVRDASHMGPICPQPALDPGSIYSWKSLPMNEDCLSLNIWKPRHARGAPVLVWLHGGALLSGSSADSLYDGAALSEQGVVVVTINYRLGVLGYLAHSGLSAESPSAVSGNYGLLDQIAALKWVKRNIAAFGGDPSNVTIAGESAGGLSVLYLMSSPLARGLFAKAIAQSAYMISTPELRAARFGSNAAESIGAELTAKLGLAGVADLRAMDASQLTVAATRAGYAPFGTVDGHVLPRQLVDVFDRGEQAKVPLLVGFNSGEIRSLRMLAPKLPQDASAYESEIRQRYGNLSDRFLELYPSKTLDESVLTAARDAMYGWTAERLAIKQSALGVQVFLYYFDHGYPTAEAANLHAFHASEIPYMFGTFGGTPTNWPAVPTTPVEQTLSMAMIGYWTAFSSHGVPTASRQPRWQPYSDDQAYMAFVETPVSRTHLLPGMYDLNEQVVCRRRANGAMAWNWNVGLLAPPLPTQAPQCR